ncbi:hypothetical protein VMCG_08560 [Cytospora schulzeri]|uniref:DUF7924 domain-containing protein n=1 Tax=Cytospora schulzeri TaxID=448051 RepID=A0A423VW00_9PEZI|nr:hypothetical protein VMCG_08560 [Valsa malicola]
MPRLKKGRAATSRTRASAGSSVLLPVDDPEVILRQARRTSRSAKAEAAAIVSVSPIQDLSDQQVDNEILAGPEAPSHSDSDQWAIHERSLSHSRHLSSSLDPSTESLCSPDEDPLAALYRSIGYLPPLDEETLELLKQVLLNPSMGSTAGRINPSALEKVRVGLKDRNVALEPCHDAFLEYIKSLCGDISTETPSEKKRHSVAWNLDLQKTKGDPQEPVFQRTVLMSMIDRHRFIYDRGDNKQPVLDFSVERLWKCRPMPSMAFQDPEPYCLTQPKADLAVSFRQYAVFQSKYWQLLPNELRDTVCYEGQATGKEVRVFHFLMIESKNSYKTPDDESGLCQSLNSATQSLHNMYEFFREAGEEHVQTFFDKVRVFSAVSTSKGIKIRAHRACLTEDARPEPAEDAEPDDVPAMCSILEDYPLQFVYDDFFEANGSEFTREKVVSIFEQLMVGYGIKELWGYLQEAAQAIEAKCLDYKNKYNKRLWRDIGYYTHGLVLRKATPSVTSKASFSTQATTRTYKHTGRFDALSLEGSQQGPAQEAPRKRQRTN